VDNFNSKCRKEIIMTFHEILIPTLVSAGSVFAGIWVGKYLYEQKEEKQRKVELKKIHFLINSDYSVFNRILKTQVPLHKKLHNNIVNGIGVHDYCNDHEKLVQLLVALTMKLGSFTYWNTLISSGLLIRLDPDELGIIQVTHDGIEELVSNAKNMSDKLNLDLPRRLARLGLSEQEKERILKDVCKTHFDGLFKSYDVIQNMVNLANKNIKWIDLKAVPIQSINIEMLQQKTG